MRPPGRRRRPRRGRPRSARPTAPFPVRDGRRHRVRGVRLAAVILAGSGVRPARRLQPWPTRCAVRGVPCYPLVGQQVGPVAFRDGVFGIGDQEFARLGDLVGMPAGIDRPGPEDQVRIALFPHPQADADIHLRADSGVLAHRGLSRPPDAGTRWTDTETERDRRGLKHRGEGEIRTLPFPPPQVRLFRAHLNQHGTSSDGHVFLGVKGRPLATVTYRRAWDRARKAAFDTGEYISPLARRPLRPAPRMSTWLNGGVAPAQVAEWAGHSVEVLLRT